MEIQLRPVTPEDDPVLFEIFCSAHEHKFAPLELPEDQLEQLLKIQFEGQRRDFLQRYPGGRFDLVVKSGEVIGQWFVCQQPDGFLVIDITFLPCHRTGIATRLVRGFLREARDAGKPVRAHVEATNPARRLWLRMGFQKVGDDGAYWALEYPVSATGSE